MALAVKKPEAGAFCFRCNVRGAFRRFAQLGLWFLLPQLVWRTRRETRGSVLDREPSEAPDTPVHWAVRSTHGQDCAYIAHGKDTPDKPLEGTGRAQLFSHADRESFPNFDSFAPSDKLPAGLANRW